MRWFDDIDQGIIFGHFGKWIGLRAFQHPLLIYLVRHALKNAMIFLKVHAFYKKYISFFNSLYTVINPSDFKQIFLKTVKKNLYSIEVKIRGNLCHSEKKKQILYFDLGEFTGHDRFLVCHNVIFVKSLVSFLLAELWNPSTSPLQVNFSNWTGFYKWTGFYCLRNFFLVLLEESLSAVTLTLVVLCPVIESVVKQFSDPQILTMAYFIKIQKSHNKNINLYFDFGWF